MGKRCGCAGNCTCLFQAGRGVRLSGAGTELKPVLVEIHEGQPFVQGAATDTVAVTVTGSGTPDDPYIVSMVRYAGTAEPLVFAFTTPGSYVFVKPSFGTLAKVSVLGAGGGGAGAISTYVADSINLSTFGSVAMGGLAGQRLSIEYLLADLPAEVPVVVGVGGGGGPGGYIFTTPSPAAGGSGGASSFGSAVAPGGAGGQVIKSPFTSPVLPLRQDADGPPPNSVAGDGGIGGVPGYLWTTVAGGNGGAPLGQPALGGTGGGLAAGTHGVAGGNNAGRLAPWGTGGGGGRGMLVQAPATPLESGGGIGGAGGVGAGGGGGGVMYVPVGPSPAGPPGGAGGAGAVLVLIQ